MARKELDYGESIDKSTFDQILEMDDEGDNEFSTSIVFGFFEQAEQTFEQMKTALQSPEPDLTELSHLGHFLKGSSATLGLTRVRDCCERIQNFGQHKNAAGDPESGRSDSEWVKMIASEVRVAQAEYVSAERRLKAFYEQEDE